MGGVRTYPFQEGENREHWRLNYDNRVVQKMLADDEEDSEGLGAVGFLSQRLTTEALFWRLVCCLRVSPSELDSWTLGEMRMAAGYLDMQNDYKRIWSAFFELKKEDMSNGTFGDV